MRAFIAAALAVGAACAEPGDVVCGDGRTCPAGTTCDDVRSLCLTQAQTTACTQQAIADGDVCDADGDRGVCDRAFCEPGCGDGTTDPDEQCDDGNFASHDGCSSRCVVEVPTWISVPSAWQGMTRHVSVYHATLGRTLVLGGQVPGGVNDRIWQHDPLKPNEPERGWRDVTEAFGATMPAPRLNAAIAYDPVREVVVYYGGVATVNTADPSTYFTDTWEYAASDDLFEGERVGRWRKVTTPSLPGPRFGAQMAYDTNLAAIVLLGGVDPTIPMLNKNSQTMWTYNGATWTQLTPTPTGFVGRSRAALAFDESRSRLVMFGGNAFDQNVREFDGVSWSAIVPADGPGPRSNTAMAYDPSRGRVVVVGGTIGITPDVASDTWEWTGTTWVEINGARTPSGRRAATLSGEPGGALLVGGQLLDGVPFADAWLLGTGGWDERTPRFGPGTQAASAGAYSPNARGVVVVGGVNVQNIAQAETWLFDGTRWRHRTDIPEARYSNATVYDPDRDRFVSIGGYSDSLGVLNTTWSLAGTGTGTWSQVSSDFVGRQDFAAIYDPVGQRVIAFGGFDKDQMPVSGTTSFDGTSWTPLPVSDEPAATYHPAAAFDPTRGVIVAFDRNGDTWELAGATWTKVIPASTTTPAPREVAGFVYDPFRQRFVLAGGGLPDVAGALADIWELDPATLQWTQRFVAGSGPLPRVDTLVFTYLDNARAILLHGGRSGTNISQGDTWMLKFVSATLDENCSDGLDTDGDAQGDSEDPDCDPLPP